MAEIRQLARVGPELDFLTLAGLAGEEGNLRDRVSRWMKAGELLGVVKGIYVTAPELRKRPVSLEILANKIFGPSYVSFEYVLARAGLIPEAVRAVTSATIKRNRDFDTPLGRFSYRHLPAAAYSFGWTRRELGDGSGWLEALPEKALLDLLYRSGSLRSAIALESRLFEDLRVERDLFRDLDQGRLADYAARMPGATFARHFARLIGRHNRWSGQEESSYTKAEELAMPTLDIENTIRAASPELAALGVKRLWLFGSRARGDARENSDIDFLVEFAEGRKNFDSFMEAADLLESRFSLRVDVLTPEAFDPARLERIHREARFYEIV